MFIRAPRRYISSNPAPHRVPSSRERGVVAVEFALIFPVLVLLVLGIIEFGFAYHSWDSTQNAAREGARIAAVSASPGAIEARVRSTSSGLDQALLSVDIQCKRGNGGFGGCAAPASWLEGDIVRVQVDYTYDFITPLPAFIGADGQMNMTSVAQARFEGV